MSWTSEHLAALPASLLPLSPRTARFCSDAFKENNHMAKLTWVRLLKVIKPNMVTLQHMGTGWYWMVLLGCGVLWCIMVDYGGLWWIMVDYGGLWWIMVDYGGLWWIWAAAS